MSFSASRKYDQIQIPIRGYVEARGGTTSCIQAQRRIAALVLAVSSAACGTVAVDLPARTASQLGTRTLLVTDRFGICWPGDVVSGAILDPVNPPATGQMIAGYDNHVHRGQSCHEQQSHAYFAAFRFDLSDISHSVVTAAYLELDRANTNVPIHVTHSYPYGTRVESQCELDVQLTTEDVFSGTSHGSVSSTDFSDRELTVYNDAGGIGSGGTVTWAVQQWALGNRPNWGFVIRPKPGAVDKNEDSCTGYWFNPRLTIRVLRPAP